MATNEPTVFGKKLRHYRRAAGLTQQELAERAGLSLRGIQDLELGARQVPHVDTAERLAEALGLAAAERLALLSARRSETHYGELVAAPAERRVTSPGIRLPVPLTSFVGREHEVKELGQLLSTTRLLTLTGAGGVGKTRLALEVARANAKSYAAGVALVEMAALADPGMVIQAVASAAGVGEQAGRPLLRTLLDALVSQQVLLVLDNCEHLLHACAELGEILLQACPMLCILATSREPLGLGVEVTAQVPPLSLPRSDRRLSVEELGASEAVRLFVQRAGQRRPGFALTSNNASAIAQVCRHLDGIPLAIELAAARVHALSVEQIAARLDDSLRLLKGGSPTSLARQRTLRATLDWSYGLLGEAEQVLLARLAVFAGGWTLEGAEAVCAGDGIAQEEVLDLLANLVDKSLVLADGTDDGPQRYRMLATLRQYGQERLLDRGEDHSTRQRQAMFFLELVEQAEMPLMSGADQGLLSRLDLERDNLRAALRWLIGQAEAEHAQRLAGAARRFWFLRGYVAEAQSWLQEVLALDPAASAQEESELAVRASSGASLASSLSEDDMRRLAARAKVLLGIAQLASGDGSLEVSERAEHRSLRIYRLLGDKYGAAWVLQFLGQEAILRADFAEAHRLLQEALVAGQESGYLEVVAASLISLAVVAREMGRVAEAQQRAENGLEAAKAVGFTAQICDAAIILGKLHASSGRRDAARLVLEEALARARRTHHRIYAMALILIDLGRLANENGDADRARSLFTEGLVLAQEVSRLALARGLEAMVDTVDSEDQADLAVHLAGAAAALRDVMGTPLWPTERAILDTALVRARKNLSETAAAAAWTRGWTTPVDRTVAMALDLVHPGSAPGWSDYGPTREDMRRSLG